MRATVIILVFLLGVPLLYHVSRPEAVATSPCGSSVPPETIILLGTDWCPYCAEARHWLEERKLPWCEYNVEHDRIGKKLYRDAHGKGIPVLLIGEETLHGFSADQLATAIARSGIEVGAPR